VRYNLLNNEKQHLATDSYRMLRKLNKGPINKLSDHIYNEIKYLDFYKEQFQVLYL